LITAASFVTGSLTACGYCMCERSSVSCDFGSVTRSNQARLRSVSDFIPNADCLKRVGVDPSNFEDLYVNCKNSRALVNQTLSRDMLSQFSRLKFITIVRCDLTRIEPDAFEGLYILEKFDASDNNLELLPPALFGQRTLSILKLSENPRLRLDPRISKLPTCKSPFSLMDIELTKVEPSKFLCPPPRISGVDLRMSSDSALLECSADGEASQSLTVQRIAWSYRNLGNLRSHFTSSKRSPIRQDAARRRPGSLKDQLIVYASATDGHSASINPALANEPSRDNTRMTPARLPADDDDKIPSVALIPEPVDDKTRPVDRHGLNQSDYYAAKQFTLLEMIVAVIGTFLTTSLAFLLCCQFARWYRRRDRKRLAAWPALATLARPPTATACTIRIRRARCRSTNTTCPVWTISIRCICRHRRHRISSSRQTLPLKLPSSASVVNGGGGGIVVATAANSNEFLDFSNPRLKYN
uniref:LRRCT domain-containing protein n=1 Tax=Macrostomum lignano TaxID=282301 RepID=A0A1I8JP91_9PLAT